MSTTTKQDARSRKIAQHERYALSAFKNHVIRQDLNQGLFRSWRCGAPDDSNHHFHVTTTPGRIFVAGDNGTMVWERTEDMIPWCRGSINSIEYFASKVPHEIKTREWDADVARDWLQREIEDAKADADADSERIRELTFLLNDELHDEANEHSFCVELYESGVNDGGDWPDLTNYTSNFLWCREDLKWFLAHLTEVVRIPAPARSGCEDCD